MSKTKQEFFDYKIHGTPYILNDESATETKPTASPLFDLQRRNSAREKKMQCIIATKSLKGFKL